MVDVDRALHVLALIQGQVDLLILSAGGSVRERRDPGALWLDTLRRLRCECADQAGPAALDREVWIQNRVLWFPYARLGEAFYVVLSVFHGVARFEVVLEGSHEELRR